MLTFNEAKALFDKARDKAKGYRLPGRLGSTRLVKTAQGYGVKLHNTVVVEILSGGRYLLNTGGWQTPTTKERINLYSPVTVYQRNYAWFIRAKDGREQAFCSGMLVVSEE